MRGAERLEFHSGQTPALLLGSIGRCYAAKKDFCSEGSNASAALAVVFTSYKFLTFGASPESLSRPEPMKIQT